jgi:hypothetical protein
MAEQAKGSARRRLAQDALVERLKSDPSATTDLKVLTGFLGKDTREGYWRLYSTPELSHYVEFAEADIVHSQPLPEAMSPIGGTIVWLDRKAPLRIVRVDVRELQTEFLQGDIERRFRPLTRPGGSLGTGMGPGLAATNRTSFCDIILCSLFPGDSCHTQLANCISREAWPCV